MKVEKTYKENGIKITRYAAKKVSKKQVIIGRTKRQAGWSEPKQVQPSSIYNSLIKRTGRRTQDSLSSNKGSENREWQYA